MLQPIITSKIKQRKYIESAFLFCMGVSWAFIALLVILSTIQGLEYFNIYKVGIQNPVQFRNFINIEPRPVLLNYKIIKEAQAKEPAQMTTEEYICHVFGRDCKIALAISQAENGTRQCDRFGVNTNNTIDVGIFQINSTHLKKGWKLTDLLDCHKNIDYAHQLYQEQGFNPWVAYQNQSYKRFLQ
jgi:hypothetical protein